MFIKCSTCGVKLGPEALPLPSAETQCEKCKKQYPIWRLVK